MIFTLLSIQGLLHFSSTYRISLKKKKSPFYSMLQYVTITYHLTCHRSKIYSPNEESPKRIRKLTVN